MSDSDEGKTKQPVCEIEIHRRKDGIRLFGDPVLDTNGAQIEVRESSTIWMGSPDEGVSGPFLWLSVKPGRSGITNPLLTPEMGVAVRDRINRWLEDVQLRGSEDSDRVDLDHVRALLSAASPGPWSSEVEREYDGYSGPVWEYHHSIEGPRTTQHWNNPELLQINLNSVSEFAEMRHEDVQLVVEAPTLLAQMADEISSLRGQLAAANSELEQLREEDE